MDSFDPRWSDDVRGGERDRGVEIGRELPRGSGGSGGPEREPARSRDPRDVFVNHVDLPRGETRERVYSLRESYMLRGSESRTLATVGAFRVVPAGNLRDHDRKPLDPNRGELHHLRREGLVDTVPSPGRGRALVVLTDRGRQLLDRHRPHDSPAGERQEFYSGIRPSARSGRTELVEVRQPRELEHDAKVYAAYLRAAERLQEQGARIRRVVLDLEVKRDYQRFLQERNRGRGDSDGRPDRTLDEIHRWAAEHKLPEQDGHVQIPDARIEFEDADGRLHWHDIEIETEHYRGQHAAAKASSGFNRYRSVSVRIVASGNRGGGGRRGRGRGLAEEVFL
ncbi:MAG: hypothetical protein AB7N65_29700 [Vicinamibacterales bacterium]